LQTKPLGTDTVTISEVSGALAPNFSFSPQTIPDVPLGQHTVLSKKPLRCSLGVGWQDVSGSILLQVASPFQAPSILPSPQGTGRAEVLQWWDLQPQCRVLQTGRYSF